MNKRLNRLEILEYIKNITGTKKSQEIFKNYINLDENKYQVQFLQHKSFGITFRDIVFISEESNTDVYHEDIKNYLKTLYNNLNITLKTTNVFSVI